MAPTTVDDSHVFLYYCLQNCSGGGKIDWGLVAVATGSTRGAAAMRYKRLKEKIEGAMGSGGTAPAAVNPQATSTAGTKKAAGPRKRKASDIKDEEDEDDVKPSQLDGQSEYGASCRQTRGKKLNFDLLATFTSDDDMSLDSFEKGDTDFVLHPATMKSDDEDESFSGPESSTKPSVKRVKKNQPPDLVNQLSRVLREGTRSPFPFPPKSIKHGSRLLSQTTASKGGKALMSKVPPPSKSSTESTIPASQRPLPSVEFSPSPSATCSVKSSAKNPQSVVDADSDVGLLSLPPGTLLSFPTKIQTQPSRSITPQALIAPTQSFSATTFHSINFSSHDSAGRMLKQNLRAHAEQLELRPEDSVSNVGDRSEEEDNETPVTPKGLVSNTVRFFKGFLTPQT